MKKPLLKVHQVSFLIDDVPLFKSIDFLLEGGVLLHLQGPNGVGKTSLLRTLIGLSSSYQGTIEWQTTPCLSVGYLGHLPGFNNVLSLQENMRYFSAIHGQALNNQDIEQVLRRVHLWFYAEESVGQLSAGQQQRFKIAQLLCLQRAVWVMDEPFTSLDHSTCMWLEQQMLAHVQLGGAVIFTSHHAFSATDAHYQTLALVAR
jgi:heme exporter protein A